MPTQTPEPTVDEGTARRLLRTMLTIRRFEEECSARSDDGELPGFLHLDHGHEGNHAGMGTAMDDDDWLAVGGARLVGQYIAKDIPLGEIMAELYGKRDGSNHGKGGQMHVADVDRKLYGHAATIGSGQNPAVGLALSQQMLETGQVAVTTIGDGGTSRGSFHTALIFAAYWNLPVVFIIENNNWAISTPAENLPPDHLADYGEAVNIPTEVIEGWDAEAVYNTVSEAVERARSGDGPTVIESEVARLVGHFEADPEAYRDPEQKAEDKEKRDPLKNYRARLLEHGVVTEAEIDGMKEEIDAEIADAVEYARESEHPAPEEAYEDVLQLPLYGQEGSQ